MRKIPLSIVILATTLLLVLYTAPAHAQSFGRTFVAVGSFDGAIAASDTNTCQANAPCATFAGAIAKTVPGGEVNCLTSGSFGGGIAINITQPITIDCHGVYAGIEPPAGVSGVSVQLPVSGGAVTLRGLNINGLGAISNGIFIQSPPPIVPAQAATTVYVEDVVIDNFNCKQGDRVVPGVCQEGGRSDLLGNGNGIYDMRTSGQLFIRDSTIRNNAQAGVYVARVATPPGCCVNAVLENVYSVGNDRGIDASNMNQVVVSRSVMSGNTTAGIAATGSAQVFVDNTEITGNATGVKQDGGVIILANSDIAFNATGITAIAKPDENHLVSYGNNRIYATPNEQAGIKPTPIGAASSDLGEQ
jgi:hypothetical protein